MMTRRLGLVGLAGTMAAACTPARLFNTVTLDDPARTLGRGAGFGADPRQKLDVYGPRRAEGKAPIALWIYGGSWDSGARAEYVWTGKALAAQGFVTLVPDYRLTSQAAFPAFLEDVALAVKWAVDHGAEHGGDPERIVLVGHSAGAFNAAMVALNPIYLNAVGVERSRIRAFAGLAGPYDIRTLNGPVLSKTFGAAADPSLYSVVRYASQGSPAAFLAHGSADTTVGPRNTETLAAALKAQGVEVEEHIYPGLSHIDVLLGLSTTFRRRWPLHGQMMSFLRRQTGLDR